MPEIDFETLKLVESLKTAAGQAKNLRDLEKVVHEYGQAFMRFQFQQLAPGVEAHSSEKKDVQNVAEHSSSVK